MKGEKNMKIYVVETVMDYCVQVGFSTDKKVAEKEANKLNKTSKYYDYFVTEYTLDKNNWCEFNAC